MSKLSGGAIAGVVVAAVVVTVAIILVVYFVGYKPKQNSKKPHHSPPAPAPGVLQRLGAAATHALANTDFVINAKQALAMIEDKAKKSTIIVAMQGCGACQRLRAALTQLKAEGKISDADNVGVLLTSEWGAQLRDKLPAHAMPQMYRVGDGAPPVKGPTGYATPQKLLDYIKGDST